MSYEERRLARQKVRYNSDNDDVDLVFQLVEAGAKVTPDSATIEIFKPGSTTAVLDAAAMTVSGSLLTYNVLTTTVADFPVDQGYRADIVVTFNTTETADRHFIFDVAKYLFTPNLAFDQLVALDDEVRGMAHDNDEAFGPIIEASRDELQEMIESRIRTMGARLLEEHILDASRAAIPFRRYVLANIFREKGNTEKADYHEGKFETLFGLMMSSLAADGDQDGQESSDVGGVAEVVFTR